MKPAELNRAVAENRIPTLLFLYGEETFLLDRALEKIRDALVPPEARDFNLSVFDGRSIRAVSILDTARTLPVFAPRRMVWVRDAQHLAAAELEDLLPYLKDPAPETVLVFTADKIDGRRKFFQEFKKQGALVEFKGIYENQLPAFVKGQAEEAGRAFTEDALALFCRRVGTNLQEAHGELVKLFTYLGERRLADAADVAAIVSDTRTESIFELVNAVGRKKSGEALRLLHRLLEEGVVPLVILTMLVRHFRQLWKARELLAQEAPRGSIARRIGINPYFLDGLLDQARHFSGSECRRAFELFLGLDLALKSSGAHPAALLEKTLLELTGSSRRR